MSVEVADGKFVQATGYGSMAHPLLTTVWYVPEFEGRPMLFSENQAMLDNLSSQRKKKTVIFRDEYTDELVLSGKSEAVVASAETDKDGRDMVARGVKEIVPVHQFLYGFVVSLFLIHECCFDGIFDHLFNLFLGMQGR